MNRFGLFYVLKKLSFSNSTQKKQQQRESTVLPISTSIAEQPEPRERMVQVVKWYLSAFHAGRKGSVAKKPYNPILGEVFYCHWDLPSEADDASPLMVRTRSSVVSVLLTNVNKVKPLWACVSGSWREENKKNKCCFYLFLFLFFNLFHENLNEPLKHNRMIVCFFFFLTLTSVLQETVSDGPIPWSSPNNVCFVAEQVSHHPPSECWEHTVCGVLSIILICYTLREIFHLVSSFFSFCILCRMLQQEDPVQRSHLDKVKVLRNVHRCPQHRPRYERISLTNSELNIYFVRVSLIYFTLFLYQVVCRVWSTMNTTSSPFLMDTAGVCLCLCHHLKYECDLRWRHWLSLSAGRFWLCRGWSWVVSATSPAPSLATVQT